MKWHKRHCKWFPVLIGVEWSVFWITLLLCDEKVNRALIASIRTKQKRYQNAGERCNKNSYSSNNMTILNIVFFVCVWYCLWDLSYIRKMVYKLQFIQELNISRLKISGHCNTHNAIYQGTSQFKIRNLKFSVYS